MNGSENNPENTPMTHEEKWDAIAEDNAWLEGQKEKFADNPEVQAKVMKYLSKNEAMMRQILEDIEKEEAGAQAEKQAQPDEMRVPKLGSVVTKAVDSEQRFVDKDGFVHRNREDALGNADDNRNASFGRAS